MSAEQHQLALELHRPKRKRFPTRPIIVKGFHETWEADLVDMQHLAKWNRRYKYMLTVIDILSKFAFARPLKSKTGEAVTAAFEDILQGRGQVPSKLHTDRGKEFLNTKFQSLLKKNNMHHYYTFSGKKSTIIERWNRTLKSRMYRMFTERNSLKWVDMLEDLVSDYNNTTHRTTQMKPAYVNEKNQYKVLHRIQEQQQKKKRKNALKSGQRYRIGDIVRVSRAKSSFAKGYTPNWTEELFKVSEVHKTIPIIYRLEDLAGSKISGTFYAEELQKTKIPGYARIERILARKTAPNGRRMIRVKWKGYDSRFNQWIPVESTRKL